MNFVRKVRYFLHICCVFAIFNGFLFGNAWPDENKSIEEIIKNDEKEKNNEVKKVLENVESNKDNSIKEILIKNDSDKTDEKNNKPDSNKIDKNIENDLKGKSNEKKNNLPSFAKNVDISHKKNNVDNLEKKLTKNELNDAISELQNNDIENTKNAYYVNDNLNNNKVDKMTKNDDKKPPISKLKIDNIEKKEQNNDLLDEKNNLKIEIISTRENKDKNKSEQDNNEAKNYDLAENKEENKTKQENKDIKKNNKNVFDKLYTIFDFKKAMDFDYNKVKYFNYGFLENVEERKIIKQMVEKTYKEQEQIEKKKEIKKKISDFNKESNNKKKVIIRENNILQVYSLVYFNENDWKCKINNKVINNDNLYDIFNNKVSILNINKGSITFMLRRTDSKTIKIVKNIQENKSSYYYNYYIINEKGKDYVVFKLFIGQKIDLNTMKISG